MRANDMAIEDYQMEAYQNSGVDLDIKTAERGKGRTSAFLRQEVEA